MQRYFGRRCGRDARNLPSIRCQRCPRRSHSARPRQCAGFFRNSSSCTATNPALWCEETGPFALSR
jgi:hypothetical protein